MNRAPDPASRDHAIRFVRGATFAGVVGAFGLTWVFGNLAEAYFSGKPPQPTKTVPPTVPVASAPVQKPPKVIKKIVHRPYQAGGSATGWAPRPPSYGPAPAPPPAAPACKSTPSKPC